MVITTILVGYFDDPREARVALDELIGTGIDPRCVEMAPQPLYRRGHGKRDPLDGDMGSEATAERFRSTVMTVSITDDMRIEEISDILELHGSSDTEQYAPGQRIAGDAASNLEAASV